MLSKLEEPRLNTVTVIVPPSMRKFLGGRTRVPVQAETVRGALDALAGGSDTLRGHLFDQTNAINRFVRVFVNGRQIHSSAEEPVSDGAEVTILVALAGG
ncbi:MoaD/ThiS family protein (plasmid) [Mycetohabitans rhizoxinica]